MNPPKPNFNPLVSTAQRQKIFGKFEYRSFSGTEDIVIHGNWEKQNIVKIQIPQPKKVGGGFVPRDLHVRFHKLAAAQLQALWKEWEDAGLLHLVKTWAGSFVPRFVRGSRSTLSNHAFGTAFDINAAWNGLGRVPAKAGTTGSVRELVAIAHKHGFYWGGHFSRPDGMHFEVAVVKSEGSSGSPSAKVYRLTDPMMEDGTILRMQMIMRDEKLYSGPMSSKYEPLTEKSIRDYQTKHKLKVDGIAGPETLRHMKLI